MLIPVEVEQPEAFIGRARAKLADQGTHIYIDTSLVMWLTAVGPCSRAAFIDWVSTLGDRVHVPTWSFHEYYRHHQRRTQVNEIAEKCSAVERALSDLKAHMRVYADGPLSPGRPEMAFVQDLETAAERVESAMKLAQTWDYDSAAVEVISWMNRHALASTNAFESFANLKVRGGARYEHEVPPGFEDGHKSVNRFGDLIFWEDVIADAGARNAKTVVVLTRDRKKDWFFSALEGEPSEDLRRLKGKWNPVPVAHPMLNLEMRLRAGAELILIDELYLGGVMWLTDKRRFGRLAAVTFGMDLARLEAARRPPPGIAERAAKRDAKDTIGLSEANRIVQVAKANKDRSVVLDLFVALSGSAPNVEATINAVTTDSLNTMEVEDLTVLSQRLFANALTGASAEAALARRLLDALDMLDALHASAIIGGMLFAAYVENGTPRSSPAGQLLQELLEWRVDHGVARVVEASAREFKRLRSPALYLPSTSLASIEIMIAASPSNTTTPVAIGQIYVGTQAILIDPPLELSLSLSVILGADVATVKDVVTAVGRHYGVPVGQLRVIDASDTELRTILSTTGLERFDPLRLPIRALELQATVVKPENVEPAAGVLSTVHAASVGSESRDVDVASDQNVLEAGEDPTIDDEDEDDLP